MQLGERWLSGGPRRPLRLLAGLWEAGAQVRSRERVAAGSAEPAPHRRPRGSIRGADGTDLPPWTETRHREEVLIKTPKRVCLIERIRDKILKGQHALPGEHVFPPVFYWSNHPTQSEPRRAPGSEGRGRSPNNKPLQSAPTNAPRSTSPRVFNPREALTATSPWRRRLREVCPRSRSQ